MIDSSLSSQRQSSHERQLSDESTLFQVQRILPCAVIGRSRGSLPAACKAFARIYVEQFLQGGFLSHVRVVIGSAWRSGGGFGEGRRERENGSRPGKRERKGLEKG